MRNVTSVESFMKHLRQMKPNGDTPIDQIFNKVIQDNDDTI